MRRSRLFLFSLLAVGMVAANQTVVSASDEVAGAWNQWRGAQRTGTSSGDPFPDDLSGLQEIWQVELGKGYPGPVIHGRRVFVVETVDEATEQARAFDAVTGEELWRHSWRGSGEVPFFARKNGDWVRSTPAVDSTGLYVSGMEEVLRRLAIETGEELWAVDLPAKYGTKVPDFGFATSPLLVEGELYLQAADSVLKLDAESGEVLWRALGDDTTIFNSGAFSSPVLTVVAGRRQLLIQTREALHGLDPETGDVLWRQEVPHFRGMNILTPTLVGEDRVLTSSYRNKTYLYEVGAGESDAANPADGLGASLVWEHKSHAYMSSPVVVDGHAYLHLGNRRLVCLDLATGKETWTSEPFGEYWSMVERDGRILALDSDGELLLLEADPDELVVLDRRQVSDQSTWAHLAVAGDRVYVRGLESLRVFSWPSGAASR